MAQRLGRLTTKDKLDNLLRKIEDRFENTFKIKFTGNESFTFMVNPRRTDGTLVISRYGLLARESHIKLNLFLVLI